MPSLKFVVDTNVYDPRNSANQIYKYAQKYERLRNLVRPDGVGLAIFFMDPEDRELSLISGPSFRGITPCIGGKVESNDLPLHNEWMREYSQETFGFMKISYEDGKYFLTIDDKDRHELTIENNATVIAYNYDKEVSFTFTYLNFCATCNTVTKQQLIDLAAKMSPIAKWFNRIGNFLNGKFFNPASKTQDNFPKFWKDQNAELDSLVNTLKAEFDEIEDKERLLGLISEAFKVNTLDEALDSIYKIQSRGELYNLKESVGDYSERFGYHAYSIEALMPVLKAKLEDKNNQDPFIDLSGNVSMYDGGVGQDDNVCTTQTAGNAIVQSRDVLFMQRSAAQLLNNFQNHLHELINIYLEGDPKIVDYLSQLPSVADFAGCDLSDAQAITLAKFAAWHPKTTAISFSQVHLSDRALATIEAIVDEQYYTLNQRIDLKVIANSQLQRDGENYFRFFPHAKTLQRTAVQPVSVGYLPQMI